MSLQSKSFKICCQMKHLMSSTRGTFPGPMTHFHKKTAKRNFETSCGPGVCWGGSSSCHHCGQTAVAWPLGQQLTSAVCWPAAGAPRRSLLTSGPPWVSPITWAGCCCQRSTLAASCTLTLTSWGPGASSCRAPSGGSSSHTSSLWRRWPAPWSAPPNIITRASPLRGFPTFSLNSWKEGDVNYIQSFDLKISLFEKNLTPSGAQGVTICFHLSVWHFGQTIFLSLPQINWSVCLSSKESKSVSSFP